MDINYNKIKTLRRGETTEKLTNIYVLIDPITNLVRYVGKTDDIKIRLKEHIRKAKYSKTHKNNWINSLLNKGLNPIIETIDKIPNNEASFWEIYWIEQFKAWGFNLTNIAIGGLGGNLGSEVNKKISESKKGFKHSEETKNSLRNFRLGKKHNEETIKMFSDTRKGINNPMWGKKRTESSKKYTKIIQLDINNNFLKEWQGVTIVANELKISRQSITDVCYGRHKTAGGYKWIKAIEYEQI